MDDDDRRLRIQAMKISYFVDTDTLYIEFRPDPITETRDLDENTVVEFDAAGNLCSMTVEHAQEHAALPHFSFEQVAAD